MLKEVVPFERVWLSTYGPSRSARAVISFVRFLERRLGAEFLYDHARIGYESPELAGLLELAEKLRARGVIRSYGRSPVPSDEPRIAHWYAEYATENSTKEFKRSRGSSLDDHPLALTKTLAEALERYVWFTHHRLPSLRSATTGEMENEGCIRPERFASYSGPQRKGNAHLRLDPASRLSWTKGYSWAQEKPVWVPAQVVSGHRELMASGPSKEPVIRPSITNGLATHPKQTNALLSGALEVIERDAYMITWLNQISPPRIELEELSRQSKPLSRLLELCRRYRFTVHALRLPTDAPAYVICAVLEDTTGALPRFSFGLKAGRDSAAVTEGALLEALRAHMGTRERKMSPHNDWDSAMKAGDIMQHDRLMYWAEEGRSDRLAFLIRGDVRPLVKEKWETDTDEGHFARIISWCREQGYELASVNFSDAPANLPGWHIEFVVIPELQWIHYNEKFPCLGGDRLREIPRKFGYTPREPYLDDPHPFA